MAKSKKLNINSVYMTTTIPIAVVLNFLFECNALLSKVVDYTSTVALFMSMFTLLLSSLLLSGLMYFKFFHFEFVKFHTFVIFLSILLLFVQ